MFASINHAVSSVSPTQKLVEYVINLLAKHCLASWQEGLAWEDSSVTDESSQVETSWEISVCYRLHAVIGLYDDFAPNNVLHLEANLMHMHWNWYYIIARLS